MNFLDELNEAFTEGSRMEIKIRKKENNIIFKVIDRDNKEISGVKIFFNNSLIGKTDNKGCLIIGRDNIPKKGVVKAVIGLYSAKKIL
ncbi:hypothetical protein COS83_05010 [archaeon CG07_land_8_20_14_0_80_38_8]|nr:MAG: hypothetical protein COS83_05010 [archaeon CG07_land_8_20_14_0_80_38_8]